MALRNVVVYPHPALSKRAEEVRAFDEELARLAADMIETMHANSGVGLAANQVGVLVRLMVVDLSAGEDPDGARVFVNPEILEAEGEQSGEEGCLSFPGLFEIVTRPAKIRYRACDLRGNPFEGEAEGFLARAICHEIDHLDGIVFLKRMSPLKRRLALKKIERLVRQGEWPREGVAGGSA
ncbi:MAG: peptide deformylase [Acidobacteria bacterium]|nr:MAG: peptide deformylase [Acidobacteriota bacterium]